MNDNLKHYYFSAVKLCCIIIVTVYFISNSGESLHAISVEWFLLAVTMVAALGYEVADHNLPYNKSEHIRIDGVFRNANKFKLFFLIMEIILTVILTAFFRESNNGLFILPIIILDTIVFFRLSFLYSLFSVIGVFFYPNNLYIYLSYCLFMVVIYFQNFMIIEKYRRYLGDFEQEEYQLKDSISSQVTIYKEQLEQSSLVFENKMLEEKARLSQALHDKLGHSINGSIYQLEACKVLMDKEPEQSRTMMQGVINNLRSSMDEIRLLLRREKPDKKRMAYLQLVQLCTECKNKYGIQAEFKITGEDKEIPESLWEVLLDNATEAVTNALKYSKCTNILIEIIVLHKVIRCSIQDNGIGCEEFKEGMGIQGMKNRTRKVNGYIDVNCDNGFRINMIIPFKKECPDGEN